MSGGHKDVEWRPWLLSVELGASCGGEERGQRSRRRTEGLQGISKRGIREKDGPPVRSRRWP